MERKTSAERVSPVSLVRVKEERFSDNPPGRDACLFTHLLTNVWRTASRHENSRRCYACSYHVRAHSGVYVCVMVAGDGVGGLKGANVGDGQPPIYMDLKRQKLFFPP
jgi:hypothetical protein